MITELNTATLFDQLNRFRTANGKAPLKAWKESKAKLIEALNKESNFEAPLAEIQKQQTRQEVQQTKEHVITVEPHEHKVPTPERTAELKAARLENERKNAKLEEMEKEQPSPSAQRKPSADKTKRIKSVTKKTSTKRTSFSAAQIILDFGIDPKQGRALLRKHKVAKTPEAIRAFFTARKK